MERNKGMVRAGAVCDRGIDTCGPACGVGTVGAREEGEGVRVAGHRRLAAHVVVVVVVALWRRRRHEGRRWRQARGPPPRAARKRVHGGERAHVAHALGAPAAGRLRPVRDRYVSPANPHPATPSPPPPRPPPASLRARSSIAARPLRLVVRPPTRRSALF
ncbi:unnamed protein product, partial [Iphiclides podalirius]